MASEPKRMRAVIKDPQHCQRVVDSVQLFNTKQDLTDLCFICARGQTVNAHKLLLCTVSTLMKQMFLELPNNLDTITIHLPDVESRTLRHLLDFLYEGQLKIKTNADFCELRDLMDLLGVALLRSSPDKSTTTHLVPEPTASASTSQDQPVPSQPVYYMQTPAVNGQGPVQYMLATPGAGVPSTSMSQAQMVPTIMTPSGVQMQMVQTASTSVSTPVPVQPNNIVQVVPQNSGQVVPMVAGNQIVQCSNQMVMQGSQSTIINNNQNIQNQVAQPNRRPQYVMPSPANQIATSRQRTNYTQPQVTPQQRVIAASRARPNTQPALPTRNNAINNNVMDGEPLTSQDIRKFLNTAFKNYEPIESLSVEQLREALERKFGCDLTKYEAMMEEQLKVFKGEKIGRANMLDTSKDEAVKKKPCPGSKKGRKKKRVVGSDDERDEDFDPRKYVRK